MAGPVTAEDLYRFRWIDHVRLSRDGERVAYQVAWGDEAARQNRSRIVVRRVLDPEPVTPTGGTRRDHSPEFSPDGGKLAFVSRVGPADQLFVTELETGDTRQLTHVADGVSSPSWSPDGSRIAVVGLVLSDPDAVVDDPRTPEGREQMRRPPVARVVRRLDYKHDGQGYVDGRHHHLFAVAVDGGDAKQLTSGAWDVTGFDWSPDSTRFVVSGNAEPGADLQRELNLYMVDLDANRRRLGGGFLLSSPVWSPNGDQIAFIAPNGLDAGLIERLWVVSLAGGGPRCLTSSFDQAVNDSVITDMRAGHGVRVCWSAEGDRIYFLSSGPGVTGVFSVDLEGDVRQEVGGRRRIYDFDVASGVLAFSASDASNPGDLYLVTHGAEARATDLNPWIRDRYIAEPERVELTAGDGWKLEGWILKPDTLDTSRLHPLVMEIHGGPHGQYGWSFFHELQLLAGMGFVVFYMNPRGSDGYGERFRREVVRDWGGKDYLDLMSGLDQVLEHAPYVDRKRLGVGGGSYGGYMTNWIIGQTDRFGAAVSMRSISNLVSEYSQHDIVLWGTLELGPPPWPDLDELWRRSPIRYVQNIRTPLLLTASEMDLRCAMSQSEELFGALRLLGKTVELVRFPEESHDLSRNGRPDRRVERVRRIAAWFERYLGAHAIDRYADEETQTLPVQSDGGREWAKTVATGSLPVEPAAVADESPAEPAAAEAVAEPVIAEAADAVPAPAVDVAEQEVIQPFVSDTATAAAPIVEPEALPDLPGPDSSTAEDSAVPTWGDAIAEPAPLAVSAGPDEAEPEPEAGAEPAPVEAAAGPVEEPVEEPVSEPGASEQEAVETEAETEPAPEAEASPAAAQVETEPEAASAEAAEPEAEEPVIAAVASTDSDPDPSPAGEPDGVQAATAAPEVNATIVAWPSSVSSAPAENGRRPGGAEAFDEATSVIPAWQNAPAGSKETVSLQALPPEQVASGAGFAALLTFESGPFAGRIVALPNGMVGFGRAPDNDVVVGDPATSGHHGRIEVRNGSFWISDLGSTNGTQVNGEAVIEKQLNDGDVIAIGQSTIRFTLET